jgi:hypothetical protein
MQFTIKEDKKQPNQPRLVKQEQKSRKDNDID